jgi:catechol 2,3-dioxygenase
MQEQSPRPSPDAIHPVARIGKVTLSVSSLEDSAAFYTRAVGMQVLANDSDRLLLGAGGNILLELVELPGAAHLPGRTGLYHFAVLVPSRLELAYVLRNLVQQQVPLTGFADHHVSEAIYLPDPDGHGIEIYRDRPRDEWRNEQGQLHMTTDPLDVEGLLGELRAATGEPGWQGLPPGTTMGHIHLHVSNLAQAQEFYGDLLGFEVMLNWHSAAFLSAGGYHHHLGLNTWAGEGAPPPAEDSLRLVEYALTLPDPAALEPIVARLQAAGYPYEREAGRVRVQDPSENRIVVEAAEEG